MRAIGLRTIRRSARCVETPAGLQAEDARLVCSSTGRLGEKHLRRLGRGRARFAHTARGQATTTPRFTCRCGAIGSCATIQLTLVDNDSVDDLSADAPPTSSAWLWRRSHRARIAINDATCGPVDFRQVQIGGSARRCYASTRTNPTRPPTGRSRGRLHAFAQHHRLCHQRDAPRFVERARRRARSGQPVL